MPEIFAETEWRKDLDSCSFGGLGGLRFVGNSLKRVDWLDAGNPKKIRCVFGDDNRNDLSNHQRGKLAVEVILTSHTAVHTKIECMARSLQRQRQNGESAQPGYGKNFFPCDGRAVGWLIFWARQIWIHFREILYGNKQLYILAMSES